MRSWLDRHAVALAIGASVVVVAIALLAMIAIGGLSKTPAWWERVDSIDPKDSTVIEQGEHLENAITTQLTAVRREDESQWAVAITQEQGNAWLAARLIDTITTHFGEKAWPNELKQVRIEMHDEQLVLGARVAHDHGSMIVWAHAGLEPDQRGDLWIKLDGIHLGTTRVPQWFVGQLGTARHLDTSTIGLGDGREVEILGARVHNGQLELVLETRRAD